VSAAPTALESERACLGAAMSDTEAAEVVAQELQKEDFYSGQHQRVFVAVRDLFGEGLVVNSLSVHERTGIPIADLDVFAEQHPAGAALRTAVSEVRRVGALRTVYAACQETLSRVGKESKLSEVLEGLEGKLYSMDGGSTEPADGADALQSAYVDFRQRLASGGGIRISTGLKALDRAILGFRPSLVVVAARPGMGKTALSDTCRRAVLHQKDEDGRQLGVIQFSLEMTREEVNERELALQARIDLRKILAAKGLSDEELLRVDTVMGGPGPYLPGSWFIDDSTYTSAGIRRRARILSARMLRSGIRPGLIIVDYIQLAGGGGDDRQQSISEFSRSLKLLAKELGCCVMALSQLNRNCEHRDDRRPLLSDIRESGSIEQDANIVLFVHREGLYDEAVPKSDAELIIRKQRSGPTGTVRVKYNEKLVCFEDLDEVREMEANDD
jgi:replicative DNA helicase